MRALVTGGGGFLGSYVAKALLDRGDQVRSLSRSDYPLLREWGVEQQRGDIRDANDVRKACHGMDVVFHVAAIAGIWGDWKDYYEVNTLGTKNVLEGCLANGVGRLVYTSSPSVTFDGQAQSNVNESAPYPRTFLCHYPRTKALAERLVLEANHEGRMLTCSLRPHLVWGPRDGHLIPRLIERAKRGLLRRVGNGQNLIDTIYVENAADAHLLAADRLSPKSPVAGNAYFLSQGEPVNCWNWINDILRLAGIAPVNRSIPYPIAYAAGVCLELYHGLIHSKEEPRMTRFLAAQLAKDHYFDISRARADLGYTPRVSLNEGMDRLAAWIAEGMKA